MIRAGVYMGLGFGIAVLAAWFAVDSDPLLQAGVESFMGRW